MTEINHEAANYASATAMPDQGFIHQIQTIIRQKTPDPAFGVPQLAEQLHISRAQLNRKLHFQTGYSPGKLILHHRMQLAKQLLEQSPLSIKEIAWQCGFSSLTGFCRKFRQQSGLSPSDYRDRSLNGSQPENFSCKIPLSEKDCAILIKLVYKKPWLGKLLHNIINNLDNESPNLNELAAALYMSPAHLNRKVNAVFKFSLTQLVRHLRLQHACELLAGEKLSVTEVACQAGFFDAAHLTRYFRAELGCSPGEFKKGIRIVYCIDKLKKSVLTQTGN